MDSLFPKDVSREEYEDAEQNPKLGNMAAAPIGPTGADEQMMSANNKLDMEYDLPITGSRTAKWYYS